MAYMLSGSGRGSDSYLRTVAIRAVRLQRRDRWRRSLRRRLSFVDLIPLDRPIFMLGLQGSGTSRYPFEVFSTLVGHLAVIGRRADGRLVLRSPLANLDGVPPSPGLVGVVSVLFGSPKSRKKRGPTIDRLNAANSRVMFSSLVSEFGSVGSIWLRL